MKNFVQLIGYAGKDVEIVSFESGNKKATLSLATSNYYKDTKGETVSNTQWHNIVAWGKKAEMLSKAISKGDLLIVKGSINYRNYENKNGNTMYVTEILMDEFLKTTKSATSSAVLN